MRNLEVIQIFSFSPLVAALS